MSVRIKIHTIAENQYRYSDVVGSRFDEALLGELPALVEGYEFPENGQGFVTLPKELEALVQPGVVDRLRVSANNMQITEHRGEYIIVARRRRLSKEQIGKVDGAAAIIYNRDAVLADPQVSDEDKTDFESEKFTHMLVTVLGFRGPKAPASSHRFVRNVAGGNAAYLSKSGDELREEAAAIVEYEQQWMLLGG